MKLFRGILCGFLFLSPWYTGSSQQIFHDGYLAISSTLYWEHNTHQNHTYELWMMPIAIEGASADLDIMTTVQFTPEVLHLVSYYRDNPDFLQANEVAKYSFGKLEVLYRTLRWEFIQVNFGGSLGHMGFLSPDFLNKPRFSIYFSPKMSANLFLGYHFLIKIPFELPFSIYSHNFTRSFFLKTGVELLFDPIGPTENPSPDSVFFSIGYEYELNEIEGAFSNYHRPYLKFSLLY